MVRRKRSKRWISWLIILILIIAAAIVCYLVWDNYFNDKAEDKKDVEPVYEVKKENENKIDEIKEEDSESNEEQDDKKVRQYDGDDPNKAETLSGMITYAGVQNEKLMIRVNIDQYLSDGTCNLDLEKNNSVVYSETEKIVGAASTATCEGFDVPVSRIGSGNYKIVIKLNAGEKTGVISGEVSI